MGGAPSRIATRVDKYYGREPECFVCSWGGVKMRLVIVLVVAHILFICGCYLSTLGINLVIKGQARWRDGIGSPLF